MQARRASEPLSTFRVVGTVTSMVRPGGTADKATSSVSILADGAREGQAYCTWWGVEQTCGSGWVPNS